MMELCEGKEQQIMESIQKMKKKMMKMKVFE